MSKIQHFNRKIELPLSHTAFLNITGLKSYLKDSPICLDLEYYQPKKKSEKLLFRFLWVIYPFFLNDAVNSLLKNASIIHLKLFQIGGEKTQRQQSSLKTKLIDCPIQNHILKKQDSMKLKFTHFPVIKNTIKRIEFKNTYESSIIFQSLIYASIPA